MYLCKSRFGHESSRAGDDILRSGDEAMGNRPFLNSFQKQAGSEEHLANCESSRG